MLVILEVRALVTTTENPPTPVGSPGVWYFCWFIVALERLRPPLYPLQGGLAGACREGGVGSTHQGLLHKPHAAPSCAQQATIANPNTGMAPKRHFGASLGASYMARGMLSQTHLAQDTYADLHF